MIKKKGQKQNITAQYVGAALIIHGIYWVSLRELRYYNADTDLETV